MFTPGMGENMKKATLWFGVLTMASWGCSENGGGVGVSRANLSHSESSRYEEVRARATAADRLQGMAELANELTNERAAADGLLDGRVDVNTGRAIEERYGAMRAAMMDDLAEDQADVIGRLETAEPLDEFRSHDAREAVAQESRDQIRQAMRESGASEEDVARFFREPPHVPTEEQFEEMRQAEIADAAERRERAAGVSSHDVQWPPRGER